MLLFSYDGDEGHVVVAVATSDDEGRTWSEPRTIYTGGDTPKPFGTLTRLPSGQLVAPMRIGDAVTMLRSDDDGDTWQWSDPLDCRPVVEATPYGRIVQTPQGLLMPVFGKLRIDGNSATNQR